MHEASLRAKFDQVRNSAWWRTTQHLSIRVYNELFRTRAFSMAAAMSYYFLLALLPLLIFFSALLGYLPIPNLFDQLLDTLAVVVPPQAMQMVQGLLGSLLTPHRGGLLSFGLLGYLWTASGGFVALIESLDVAYDVEKERSWWRNRLQGLLLTFTTGGLLLLGMALIILGPRFGHLMTILFPLPMLVGEVWPVFRVVTIFVLFVSAVVLQYLLGPNRKQNLRSNLPGALVAVIFIFVVSAGMGYYFSHLSNYNRTYGGLGAVIILMLWFYAVALSFLAGAELNAELLKATARQPEAIRHGQVPATGAA